MSTNAFYCPRCGKFTRHCKISSREFAVLDGENAILQGVSALNDLTGFSRLFGSVTGYNFWKCTHCGLATSRNAGGDKKIPQTIVDYIVGHN